MNQGDIVPQGYNTVNPFIITEDSVALIAFLTDVFGAVESKEAFTKDNDGLVLHSEVTIGNSVIMIADRKENWLFTPGFMQVYVKDVNETLSKAETLGATIVTKPTEFYGTLFSRLQDPWKNVWWVYQFQQQFSAENYDSSDESNADWSSESTPELEYIHDTLISTMENLTDKAIN